jgi:hypothetical protein
LAWLYWLIASRHPKAFSLTEREVEVLRLPGKLPNNPILHGQK